MVVVEGLFNLPCCGKPVERQLRESTQQQKFFCVLCGAGWDCLIKLAKPGEGLPKEPRIWRGTNRVARDILYYGEAA